MSKKLEDLTLEEIKAQMSIYQTFYTIKEESKKTQNMPRKSEREIDRDTTKNGMNLENHQWKMLENTII